MGLLEPARLIEPNQMGQKGGSLRGQTNGRGRARGRLEPAAAAAALMIQSRPYTMGRARSASDLLFAFAHYLCVRRGLVNGAEMMHEREGRGPFFSSISLRRRPRVGRQQQPTSTTTTTKNDYYYYSFRKFEATLRLRRAQLAEQLQPAE